MREHKATAVTAGVLYIVGTVSGVLCKVLVQGPVRDADDPLGYAAEHRGLVVTGALLVLVMAMALVLVPVVLFPVLRRVDEVLAIGYLTVRGAVEAACYVISATALLLMVPVGDVVSSGQGTATASGARLGMLLVDFDAMNTVTALVFCLGGAMFYALLYRCGIVPRWIAVWGLAGIPSYVAAYVLAAYAVIGPNSTTLNLLVLPLALQEMVLGVWMIARGFRPSRVATASPAADLAGVGV
ncbi:MAG: DUF4386 domain-containing protein [Actinobacteria bacterium]|nr:DUF4386 domain-containing protein [Actinomycetota bacterium]